MKKVIVLFLMSAFSHIDKVSSQTTPELVLYPKMVGYMSFILPIVKMNRNETTVNFSNSFSIGIPVGINILYSDKFGFSYEITPTIKSERRTDKMSSLLFAPGLIFRFKKGFAFVQRLAFETSGRYGITPLITKVITGGKNVNYFISASVPLRVGNNELPSMGGNLQFGIALK